MLNRNIRQCDVIPRGNILTSGLDIQNILWTSQKVCIAQPDSIQPHEEQNKFGGNSQSAT